MEKWNWAVVVVAAALMLFLMFRGGGCCGHTGSPRRKREASAPEGDTRYEGSSCH